FKPQSIKEKKMAVLWLRFLTEINKGTREAPKELLENPETSKALKILEKSAYNESELYAYERYWDYVNYERGIVEGGYYKGVAKGLAAGRVEGRAEGRVEANVENARKMKADSMPVELIAKYTGLTEEEICRL
ncbi:MAG: hypothetical protein IJ551_01285, partial [Prevotella sp.]|nr:hypothetical protein [Prevotella sp.]